MSQEFLTYTVNVSSAGSYTLRLWAASLDNPTAGVIVNGGGVQSLPIGNTGGWTNFAERSMTVSLNAGNNTIRVQGNTGGAFRQDKLCVDGGTTGGGTGSTGGVAAPTTGSYEGFFDYLDCNGGGGWVWNPSYPNQAIIVELVEGATVLATVTASNHRVDLEQAGKGNGAHGFSWSLPASLKNGQPHTITVRVAGQGFVLSNSPRTITCPGGGRLGAAQPGGETVGRLTVAPNPGREVVTARFRLAAGERGRLRVLSLVGAEV